MTAAELAERLTLTIPEAAELLGVSEWAAYKAIREDEFPLPIIKVGRRIVIPAAPLRGALGLIGGDDKGLVEGEGVAP